MIDTTLITRGNIQQRALDKCKKHFRCGLGISMGVGKTRIAIKHMLFFNVTKALIVAPKRSIFESWKDELAKLKPQEISPGETLVLKGGLDYDFMLNLDDGDAIYLEGPGYEFAPDGMILHYQWNLRKFNIPKKPDEILNLEGSATPLTNQNFSYYRDPTSGLFFWRQNPP